MRTTAFSLARMIGAFLALVIFTTSHAAPPPAEQAFEEWLDAYNARDVEALGKFNKSRLGDPDVSFALDSREETGGLDLVRIERSEPLNFTALMRERDFPALQRVIVELDSPSSAKLSKFEQIAQPLSTSEALASLDAFASKLASRDRFSGVVVVEQHGKRLYEKAFGLADRDARIPIRLNTPFVFASQGKMFTAVAILQLVESGKVALDAPIGQYLTDYPNKEVASKVTVRHLLTHRGGMGDINILGPEDGPNRQWVRTIADVIKLNGGRPPAFEPGSQQEYSNYGFILLGAIIEKVTAQSYYDYVKERVFRPAGMLATAFPTREQMAGVAVPYTTIKGETVSSTGELPWRGMSAGGGISTADDELKFANALRAGKLISKAMLAEATRRQTPWYGYGFISSPPDDYPHWGHGGGAPGMSLVLAIYPTNDVTIVCMSNRDPPVCDRLAFNVHFHMADAGSPFHPDAAAHAAQPYRCNAQVKGQVLLRDARHQTGIVVHPHVVSLSC